MQIDWRLKGVGYRILLAMPGSALFTIQRLTGRALHEPKVVSEHWAFHRRVLAEHGAKRVIEFGAGKHLGQNIYLSTLGIEQVVVDISRMIHIPAVNGYIRGLHKLGALDKPTEITDVADLYEKYRIRYVAPADIRSTGFPDDSFDACISSSTLEHLPADIIPDVLRELKRMIRPGGVISARNDYSDHYSHTDRNITEVSHLRFSDAHWRLFSPPNHYQNRLRHGHFRKMAAEAGLEVIEDHPRTPLPEWPHPVRQDLLAGDDADLFTRGDFVWRVPA